MQKEIEIKVKTSDEQMKILRKWLADYAENVGQIDISDYYLDNPKSTFCFDSDKGYKDCLQFLRVRITPKDHFFCYKKRNIDSVGKTLSVQETEVEIADGCKILEILKNVGFIDQTVIKKKRDIYIVESKFEIVIDVVENIGTFIEIELKDQIVDVKVGLDKIYDLLKRIGIKEFVRFDRGYFCMFLNPKYDFGEKMTL